MTRRKGAFSLLVTLAMLATMFLVAPSAVEAQSNPYERGPNPTESSLEANGPYSVSTSSVSSFVSGFGGGTVYYPTGTSDTFGGVAISPGFTASSSSMAWYGRRLASHGFVAIVIDTNSRFDQPNSRATQLLNALEWLEDDAPSAVRARLDPSRLAVAGHSMGGGGSLRASTTDQSLKASIPLTGWHSTKTFNTSVPQLVVGAENDSVASVNSHSIPFYNNLPSSTPKMYVELDGASHFAPNSSDPDISRMSVSWLKRFVDNDSRYNTFLCGAEAPTSGGFGSGLSDVRDNCQLGWGEGGGNGDPGDPGDPDPTCVTARNSAHVDANRAVQVFYTVYARGSADNLGYSFSTTSLQQTGPNSWTEVSSC